MLDWIVNTVNSLGYVGIALLMFLENIIPPIPSELIMPLAGFTVAQGELNFVYVVLAGSLGSILGALPWYYVGKYWGLKRIKRWAKYYGKWLTITPEDIQKVNRWFVRRGAGAAFLGRLVPGIRTFISVPAGISEMNLTKFLIYSILGTLIWVSFLTGAGYLLGNNYHLVEQYLGPVSKIIVGALIVFTIIWIARRKFSQT